MHGLRPITMLKLAVRAPSTVTLRIIVSASSPLLLRGSVGGKTLLLREPGKLSHLLAYLLAQLLQLPHRLQRVVGSEEIRHRTGRSGRRKGGHDLPRRVGVVILHLLNWLRRIRIHVAPAPESPTAAGLLERPAATLEMLSSIRRIEVAAIVEATLEAASCWSGREGRLVRRRATKRRWSNGTRLGFRWRRRAGDVGLVLDRLDEVIGEQFCI